MFPEQRWTTYLLLDAQPRNRLTAITIGLSPRLDQRRALLPVATFNVIEPMPINRYGSEMINNRARIR